jgi:hypothetical protein
VSDRRSRSAAALAALVAIPVALLVGVGVFAGLGGFRADRAAPTPSAPTPSAPTAASAPQATTPVPAPAAALDPPAARACRKLVSALPRAVRDRQRRPVTDGAGQNAAYGDPAITLACGAPPPSVPPTDNLYTLDEVCWHAAQTPQATVWTTVDREIPVRVTMPRAYETPGQWVIAFSAPVAAAVPRLPSPPGGCA